MTHEEALKELNKMTDTQFDDFFYNDIPERTRLLVNAGFVNWFDVLPGWYIKTREGKNGDDTSNREGKGIY